MKTIGIILIGFVVAVIAGIIVILISWAVPKSEIVYVQSGNRECDSAYFWKCERMEWAINAADMVFRSRGIFGVSETIEGEMGLYPDELLKVMQESRIEAAENERRKVTGRGIKGKGYENESIETIE